MDSLERKKIGIIGGGSFGTSLALIMADKGHDVCLWARNKSQIESMKDTGENKKYLPGVKLPNNIMLTENLPYALKEKDLLIFAVPAQTFRDVLLTSVPYIEDNTPVVNVAKGIEKGSLMRLSQVAQQVRPGLKYVTLSGPSHAEEVARYMPTTVAVASRDIELSRYVQRVLHTDRFRVYTNDDIIGVELGGALKNIIALGAGISDGIGYGDNAKAALMTRGITEMTRLGVALGSEVHTFSGLTGIGDLIVTCTSMHSRNRRCGIKLGQGLSPQKAIEEIGMVVEGISTAEAANDLARKHGIEMPITQCICEMLDGNIGPKDAVNLLMGRKLKNEMEI